MHNHKILLSVAVIIFVILATSCGNSKEKAEPEKENFVVTIPAQNDTGRIRVMQDLILCLWMPQRDNIRHI